MHPTPTAVALLALTAALTLPSAAPAVAGDRTIKISQSKRILSVGAFRLSSDPSVRAAAGAFGAPSSVAESGAGNGCNIHWLGRGLRITFANFGAPGRSACEADIGKAQVIRVGGSKATGWHTNRDLYIGATRRTMHRKYNARRTGRGRYKLLGIPSPYAPGKTHEVLGARISSGRVSSFILSPFAAGD
ncbi:MAG: hypothetical protein M3401_19025 [Actinomycetota bacterium]|nr:hypothetical protein [Actinomycetota bacterium]